MGGTCPLQGGALAMRGNRAACKGVMRTQEGGGVCEEVAREERVLAAAAKRA